jgi:hypothetical protein
MQTEKRRSKTDKKLMEKLVSELLSTSLRVRFFRMVDLKYRVSQKFNLKTYI